MKRTITLLLLVSITLLSCEGTVGPPGPPGPPGQDGVDGLLGSVFEIEADFTKSNDYQYLVDIPSSIEVFNSDVVLAYKLVGVDNGTDIWEPLPQTLFLGNQILMYGFDFTQYDVSFFLDGTVNFDDLNAEYTDGIVFRVAVIPAEFAKEIDVNKLDHVLKALNIDSVRRLEVEM